MRPSTDHPHRRRPVWASVLLSVLVISLGTGTVGWVATRWMKSKANRVRKEWLQHSIRELSGLSTTNRMIQEEVAELSGTNRSQLALSTWINEHVLVFANGDILTYSQRHGGGYFDGHVLLARDQNGHWLYSPYHFCGRMAMISGDQQPASIEEFCRRYSAREFDGTLADLVRKRAPTPPAVSYRGAD